MLEALPDDSSFEDTQYHLYVLEKVKRGVRAETHTFARHWSRDSPPGHRRGIGAEHCLDEFRFGEHIDNRTVGGKQRPYMGFNKSHRHVDAAIRDAVVVVGRRRQALCGRREIGTLEVKRPRISIPFQPRTLYHFSKIPAH